MLTGLLHTHSLLRFFILIALVVVIANALIGMTSRKPFGKWDNKFSLYLLIFTHMQLLVGVVLYIINLSQERLVHFNENTMKVAALRYWAVEHVVGMLIGVVLITVGRISSKRATDDVLKHRRLFYSNLFALLVIVGTILIGDRGLFSMTAFD